MELYMYSKDGKEYILPFEKGFLERQQSNQLTKRGDDGRLYVGAFAVGFVILSKLVENPRLPIQVATRGKALATSGIEGARRAKKYINEEFDKNIERLFDASADALGDYDFMSPVESTRKKIAQVTELATKKWLQAKAVKFRKIKIVIRSNNKSEIGIFANKVYSKFKGFGIEFRKYSPINNAFFFTSSVPEEISMQQYNSFPNDENKIEAMFSDKKVYLQTAMRPQDGPFYQVEGEFDLHYVDIPSLATVLYDIFKLANVYNQEYWVKYNKKNTGVQISLEVIDEGRE